MNMVIYSWFPHQKWWCSIASLPEGNKLNELTNWPNWLLQVWRKIHVWHYQALFPLGFKELGPGAETQQHCSGNSHHINKAKRKNLLLLSPLLLSLLFLLLLWFQQLYIYILLSRILHQGDSQCVGPQQCSSPCHPVFPRRAAVQCGCTTLLCAAAHPESQRGLRWEIPYEIPQRVTGNWSWASSFQQGFSECEKTWNHQAGICENICSPKYTLASCFCCDVDWFTEISHPSGDHPGIHLQNPQNSWNRNPKKKGHVEKS